MKDIRSFAPSCSRGDRTRFFLKVQDGCDYYCSYCTIPFARGRSRNGSVASLVEQARQAAAEGGKEIVLTGVNIGDFGKTTGETFFDLVKALDEVEGIERYRISSIEPNLLTDEIIEFVSRSKRFMPHFHIPLQSGSDEVLKLMRRRYDTALFASKVKKIKEVMPDSFIGVDVIVGTRGETEEYFGQAYEFIKSLDVTQLHASAFGASRHASLEDRPRGGTRRKAPQEPAIAGAFGRKDPCFLCAPYRADDAGVAGTSQTRTADARLHSQLYPCGSPS